MDRIEQPMGTQRIFCVCVCEDLLAQECVEMYQQAVAVQKDCSAADVIYGCGENRPGPVLERQPGIATCVYSAVEGSFWSRIA